ncbi:MAG: hypothetical protein NVSMB64_13570 [Candidatus Velthaea sp.]
MGDSRVLARDTVRTPSAKSKRAEDFERDLVSRCLAYISLSDRDEDSRRRSDRIGGNLYYGHHWNVAMPQNRAALTVNVTKALIQHKIAIMTKQQPIPVVEATDTGDSSGAPLMRSVLQRWWVADGMQGKLERALLLCNTTRTCGMKVLWDPTLHGGAGDLTADVIPGWRLILDNRTGDRNRMEFAGDRARMPRTRAMRLYPECAAKIDEGSGGGGASILGASSSSPVRDPWAKAAAAGANGTIVNGKPVVTAFTTNPVAAHKGEDDVEIVELYYRDRTLVKTTRVKKDELGHPKMRVVTDPEGVPQFDQAGEEQRTLEDGSTVSLPNFKLQMEPHIEDVMVPKYPHYRRTTMLMPDMVMLEDTAWDDPLPYSFYSDGEPLEGVQVKGSCLDLEDCQAALNVSLSLMMDNLRFSTYRALLAGDQSRLDRSTLNIAPGEVLHVGDVAAVKFLDFPQLSEAWFNWINSIISLMEKLIGATGIMQGESAGRVDSAAGYDTLAEIGGSRLVKSAQCMERAIEDTMEIVGRMAQKYYTEAHAVQVEKNEGDLTFERITPAQLNGSFSYRILTGSSLAWSESAIRKRVIEEFQLGFRDKVSAWKKLGIEDWREIMQRMITQPPALNAPPPPRTRTSASGKGKGKAMNAPR